MCRALYNMTLNIECANEFMDSNLCLCPDCDSFMQMCYLCNLKRTTGKKSAGLSCEEMKTASEDSLQCFNCQKVGQYCQNGKCYGHEIVNMHMEDKTVKCKWRKLIHLQRADQVNLLFLLTLLMTLKMIFPNSNICLADLICAYDAEVLKKRFEKMVYKFAQDVMTNGLKKESEWKKPEEDLLRITEFLQNLNTIYQQWKEVSDQAEYYLCELYRGIEGENERLDMKNSTRMDIRSMLKKDSLEKNMSFEAFLFSHAQSPSESIKESAKDSAKDSTKESEKDGFLESVVILKTYVMKCRDHYQVFSQENGNALLGLLSAFNCEGMELNHIRGLEKATFASRESFKADTKLILEYFKKIDIRSRVQDIVADKECWKTWEMAS